MQKPPQPHTIPSATVLHFLVQAPIPIYLSLIISFPVVSLVHHFAQEVTAIPKHLSILFPCTFTKCTCSR